MSISREQIAQRIAREIEDGFVVKFRIGIPTLVANYIPGKHKHYVYKAKMDF